MIQRTTHSLWFLAGLFVGAVLLVFGVLYWPNASAPQLAGAGQAVAQPPADVAALALRVDKLEQDQAYTLRDIAWKLDQKLLVFTGAAAFISFLAAFIGIKTYGELEKIIHERVRETLKQALYKFDPVNLPIRIWQNNKFDANILNGVYKRLRLLGMKDVEWSLDYEGLRDGIVIVPCHDKSDENRFFEYLIRHKLDSEQTTAGERYLHPEQVSFIVYTLPTFRIEDDHLIAYDNLVTANMPATAANMVMVVGRGLSRTMK